MKPIMYAAGCYGTQNLGDDAIFAGLCDMYKGTYKIVQVYLRQPTHSPAVREADLKSSGFPGGVERLIIGGGGLFFSELMCRNMNQLAAWAIDAEVGLSVEAVGLETAPEDCYSSISELFAKCNRITVRSRKSQEIAKEIGFAASVVKDFAYRISPDIEAAKNIMPEYDDSLPVIGIATGGYRDMADPLEVTLELLNEFNVLHLPHTAFCRDPQRPKTGESIGLSLLSRKDSLLERYRSLPYPDSPEQLLGIYRLIAGVVGYRYHSYVFAEIAEVPLYPRNGLSTSKSRGYFHDHPDMLLGIDGTPDRPGDFLNYFCARI